MGPSVRWPCVFFLLQSLNGIHGKITPHLFVHECPLKGPCGAVVLHGHGRLREYEHLIIRIQHEFECGTNSDLQPAKTLECVPTAIRESRSLNPHPICTFDFGKRPPAGYHPVCGCLTSSTQNSKCTTLGGFDVMLGWIDVAGFGFMSANPAFILYPRSQSGHAFLPKSEVEYTCIYNATCKLEGISGWRVATFYKVQLYPPKTQCGTVTGFYNFDLTRECDPQPESCLIRVHGTPNNPYQNNVIYDPVPIGVYKLCGCVAFGYGGLECLHNKNYIHPAGRVVIVAENQWAQNPPIAWTGSEEKISTSAVSLRKECGTFPELESRFKVESLRTGANATFKVTCASFFSPEHSIIRSSVITCQNGIWIGAKFECLADCYIARYRTVDHNQGWIPHGQSLLVICDETANSNKSSTVGRWATCRNGVLQSTYPEEDCSISLVGYGYVGDQSSGSCTDGIQNRDEQGIDCGGRYCTQCSSCGTLHLAHVQERHRIYRIEVRKAYGPEWLKGLHPVIAHGDQIAVHCVHNDYGLDPHNEQVSVVRCENGYFAPFSGLPSISALLCQNQWNTAGWAKLDIGCDKHGEVQDCYCRDTVDEFYNILDNKCKGTACSRECFTLLRQLLTSVTKNNLPVPSVCRDKIIPLLSKSLRLICSRGPDGRFCMGPESDFQKKLANLSTFGLKPLCEAHGCVAKNLKYLKLRRELSAKMKRPLKFMGVPYLDTDWSYLTSFAIASRITRSDARLRRVAHEDFSKRFEQAPYDQYMLVADETILEPVLTTLCNHGTDPTCLSLIYELTHPRNNLPPAPSYRDPCANECYNSLLRNIGQRTYYGGVVHGNPDALILGSALINYSRFACVNATEKFKCSDMFFGDTVISPMRKKDPAAWTPLRDLWRCQALRRNDTVCDTECLFWIYNYDDGDCVLENLWPNVNAMIGILKPNQSTTEQFDCTAFRSNIFHNNLPRSQKECAALSLELGSYLFPLEGLAGTTSLTPLLRMDYPIRRVEQECGLSLDRSQTRGSGTKTLRIHYHFIRPPIIPQEIPPESLRLSLSVFISRFLAVPYTDVAAVRTWRQLGDVEILIEVGPLAVTISKRMDSESAKSELITVLLQSIEAAVEAPRHTPPAAVLFPQLPTVTVTEYLTPTTPFSESASPEYYHEALGLSDIALPYRSCAIPAGYAPPSPTSSAHSSLWTVHCASGYTQYVGIAESNEQTLQCNNGLWVVANSTGPPIRCEPNCLPYKEPSGVDPLFVFTATAPGNASAIVVSCRKGYVPLKTGLKDFGLVECRNGSWRRPDMRCIPESNATQFRCRDGELATSDPNLNMTVLVRNITMSWPGIETEVWTLWGVRCHRESKSTAGEDRQKLVVCGKSHAYIIGALGGGWTIETVVNVTKNWSKVDELQQYVQMLILDGRLTPEKYLDFKCDGEKRFAKSVATIFGGAVVAAFLFSGLIVVCKGARKQVSVLSSGSGTATAGNRSSNTFSRNRRMRRTFSENALQTADIAELVSCIDNSPMEVSSSTYLDRQNNTMVGVITSRAVSKEAPSRVASGSGGLKRLSSSSVTHGQPITGKMDGRFKRTASMNTFSFSNSCRY